MSSAAWPVAAWRPSEPYEPRGENGPIERDRRQHVLADQRPQVGARVERERGACEVHPEPARRRGGAELHDVVAVPRADDEQRTDEDGHDLAPVPRSTKSTGTVASATVYSWYELLVRIRHGGKDAVGDTGDDPVRCAPSATAAQPVAVTIAAVGERVEVDRGVEVLGGVRDDEEPPGRERDAPRDAELEQDAGSRHGDEDRAGEHAPVGRVGLHRRGGAGGGPRRQVEQRRLAVELREAPDEVVSQQRGGEQLPDPRERARAQVARVDAHAERDGDAHGTPQSAPRR